MDKSATMDTIGSSFRPWLSCQGICLLNRHQTGDTDSVQPVILLPVQRDSQETFIPCEARMLWYSADRTSSQQLRDTTGLCAKAMMVLLMAGNTLSHRQSGYSYQFSPAYMLWRGCGACHCTDNIQTRQSVGTRHASSVLVRIYCIRSPVHFRDSTLIW